VGVFSLRILVWVLWLSLPRIIFCFFLCCAFHCFCCFTANIVFRGSFFLGVCLFLCLVLCPSRPFACICSWKSDTYLRLFIRFGLFCVWGGGFLSLSSCGGLKLGSIFVVASSCQFYVFRLSRGLILVCLMTSDFWFCLHCHSTC